MSRRALRRLRGDQRGQEEPGGPEEEEEEILPAEPRNRKNRGNRKLLEERGVSNPFQLITDPDEDHRSELDSAPSAPSRLADEEEVDGEEAQENGRSLSSQAATLNKTKKKKKKRKAKKTPTDNQLDGSTESKDDLGDIDSILERIESSNGVTFQGQSTGNTDSRPLLYVEHR
ncbi:hypothetical protein AB205_0159300 [Aquarana catesbeiana]|uniref:Uncharacterized protein n=1 Tax=Aquarana catesbeiana TaxID=8400 RepID=A0A2G9R5N0_AQUCT|nr:hypothetical protein AB205_0159300 [Aquarana catesbeiana]